MSLLHRRMMMTQQESMSMDKWELIADITMEEAHSYITVTEDMQGNPFRLRKVELWLLVKSAEDRGQLDIGVSFLNDNTNTWTAIGRTPTQNEDTRATYARFEQTGIGMMYMIALSSGTGTEKWRLTPITYNSVYCDKEGPTFRDLCEGLKIGSTYGGVLTPGTTIKIYGVRA